MIKHQYSHWLNPSMEHRLLRKMATPEVPSEGAAEAKEKEEGGDKAVEKQVADTKSQVEQVTAAAEAARRQIDAPQYVEMPSIKQGMVDTRNALFTALGVALPPLGVAGLAARGVGRWAKKKASGEPISMREAASEAFVSTPMEGGKSVMRSLTFPFRWAGAAAINTLKFTGHKTYQFLDNTAFELYRDVKVGMNKKLDLPEGTSPLAASIVAMRAAIAYPFKLVPELAKTALEKPIQTAIAAAIGTALITNPAAFFTGVGQFGNWIAGIVNKVIGAIPAAPPVAP